jgi:hypothetical protein
MGGLKWDYHQLKLTGFLILGFNGGLFCFPFSPYHSKVNGWG